MRVTGQPDRVRRDKRAWRLSLNVAAGLDDGDISELLHASRIADLCAELPGQFQHELNGFFVALLNEVVEVFGESVWEGHNLELFAVLSTEFLEPLGVGVLHAAILT